MKCGMRCGDFPCRGTLVEHKCNFNSPCGLRGCNVCRNQDSLHAHRVTAERDDLRVQLRQARADHERCAQELARVTAERDKAREWLEMVVESDGSNYVAISLARSFLRGEPC